MNDMRRGRSRAAMGSISRAMETLNQLPIYLDDVGALTVSDVRSRCRLPKKTAGSALGAIFIDYLQLMRPGMLARNVNRNEELSEICRTLKVTAKELGVPIVALAQLNRAVETRQEKRPMLADLRDSGSIEQEADVVAFLFRDGYYNPEAPDPDLTEFIIAKHRNGPTGRVKLRFQPEFTLFVPYGDDIALPAAVGVRAWIERHSVGSSSRSSLKNSTAVSRRASSRRPKWG